MQGELDHLNARVIRCKECPRLAAYIRQVGREKVKRFAGEKYWLGRSQAGATRTRGLS